MTRADDTLVASTGTLPDGTQIFERSAGHGFSLVLEGRPGGTGAAVGNSAFNWNPNDPTVLPDLQMEVSRPLGDGSTAVCDDSGSMLGGVPAINPPDFSPIQSVADAINDLACRFTNETGSPGGRNGSNACTLFADGTFHFEDATSTIQFCGQIDAPVSFPVGDTLVTARIRDVAGHLSAPASILIRVDSP